MVNNHGQPVTAMFDYMFAELPHDLVEQRAYAERFPEDGGHH
jgi:pyruvate dehydrogenase E1 component alpha subunit